MPVHWLRDVQAEFTVCPLRLPRCVLTLLGIAELILQRSENDALHVISRRSSLALHTAGLLIFILSRQPYVSALLLISLLAKCVLLVRAGRIK